jgi:hypothetical protein
MNIVIIFNGLGNQMSQFAFYLQKKKMFKKTYYLTFNTGHNGYELENVFNLEQKSLKYFEFIFYYLFKILSTKKIPFLFIKIQFILNLFNIKIINEKYNYEFNPDFLQNKKGINFYIGGWHSDKYFINIYDRIKLIYKFQPLLDDINNSYLNVIKNNNSVSLHIRRGDFLSSTNIKAYGNICTIDYYKRAVNKITHLITNPFFIIFSNDLQWVKENFDLDNTLYVDGNFGNASWKDMYLMTQCKHNIIANSSFSWWGAYLNENINRIVICPNKFSNYDENSDIYPESWLRISELNLLD